MRWHFVERGYPLLLSTVARQALAGTKLQGVKEVFDWIATWGVFRFRILDSMKDFDDLALERGQSDALTTTGDNLARMLYAWKEQPNGEALQAISDVFKLLLQRSDYHNVGWDVKAEVAGGTVYLSVRLYKEDDPDKWHELAFGPDGFKAVLLLASALLSRKSLILVEEPETHLDARLMDLIADMFLQGAKAGKQVIFTTHSPLLAQQVPAACIRVLSRTGSTTLPEEVIQSQQVLTAWLSDVLHERAARP